MSKTNHQNQQEQTTPEPSKPVGVREKEQQPPEPKMSTSLVEDKGQLVATTCNYTSKINNSG